MFNKKGGLVDQTFNYMSSVPYMRGFLTWGWSFVALYRGFSFVAAYYKGIWGKYDSVTGKALLIFIAGHLFLGCILLLWHKHAKASAKTEAQESEDGI